MCFALCQSGIDLSAVPRSSISVLQNASQVLLEFAAKRAHLILEQCAGYLLQPTSNTRLVRLVVLSEECIQERNNGWYSGEKKNGLQWLQRVVHGCKVHVWLNKTKPPRNAASNSLVTKRLGTRPNHPITSKEKNTTASYYKECRHARLMRPPRWHNLVFGSKAEALHWASTVSSNVEPWRKIL